MIRRWLLLLLAIAAVCACTRIVVLEPEPRNDGGLPVPDAFNDGSFVPDAFAPDAGTFDAGTPPD